MPPENIWTIDELPPGTKVADLTDAEVDKIFIRLIAEVDDSEHRAGAARKPPPRNGQ